MKNKYGINARFIEGIKKALIRNVLAEEPASATHPVVNYEELIAKARREEKINFTHKLKQKETRQQLLRNNITIYF